MRIDCGGISGDDLANTEGIQLAFDGLARDGYVVLDRVIAERAARALSDELRAHYGDYLEDRERDDTLKVGGGRYLIPVALAGRFADRLVYANPFVLAVVRQALGDDAILDSFGAVISLPGSPQQHIHRDGPLLFDATISPLLPAHALTFVLPLVDMNDQFGSTTVWPRSHRWKARDERAPSEALEIPVGSCALWDFRLFHGGTPNRSDRYRPLLYATYARRWYRDTGNFVKPAQVRLSFGDGFLANVGDDERSLFVEVP